jgi:CBS domain-containing protein
MNVARILKDKGRSVVSLAPDASVRVVVETLAKERIGALILCDSDRRVVGIISEFMTKEVRTCTERDTVDWLMEEMTSHRFRHLPVCEGGRLTGIVSIGDVVKQRIALAELEAASMREYITTG